MFVYERLLKCHILSIKKERQKVFRNEKFIQTMQVFVYGKAANIQFLYRGEKCASVLNRDYQPVRSTFFKNFAKTSFFCRTKAFLFRQPKTYKHMRRQWILFGQSFLKIIRTMRGKKALLGGAGTECERAKSWLVLASMVINGYQCWL